MVDTFSWGWSLYTISSDNIRDGVSETGDIIRDRVSETGDNIRDNL